MSSYLWLLLSFLKETSRASLILDLCTIIQNLTNQTFIPATSMATPTQLIFSIFIFGFMFIRISYSIPFIVLHGVGKGCDSPDEAEFTKTLLKYSGTNGYCIEIGNGAWDSWFMSLQKQTEILCAKVKGMKELRDGYNIVGRSQGNLIARGVVEFCEGGPPVKNFVSLAGPHAGTASIPLCGSGILCILLDVVVQTVIYSSFFQAHLAPSGYLKIPTDIPDYLQGCMYLPKLNNERPNQRNATYKNRFTSLQNLVLIMCERDQILVPPETAWFGYYLDGSFTPAWLPQQTPLYKEDWIGLKTLEKAGKVKYFSVPGDHLVISDSDVNKYIVPYLRDNTTTKTMTGGFPSGN